MRNDAGDPAFWSPRLRALVERGARAAPRDPPTGAAGAPGTSAAAGTFAAAGTSAAPETSAAVGPSSVPGTSAAPGTSVAPHAAADACDLCAEPLGVRHGHLVDLRERSLLCICRPCVILFDRPGAGGDRYRMVPERVRRLDDFRMSELDWLALRIPVELAFFFRSSSAGRVMALYPGPMGATESLLGLEHWERLGEQNPVLAEMEPDVEALLVDRTRGRRRGWLVPIDACYELVGLFRTRWRGLSGGSEVWRGVDEFFERLAARAGGSRGPA